MRTLKEFLDYYSINEGEANSAQLNKIKELEKYAKEKGYDKVVFRDRKTNSGDFTIFLYNKKIVEKRYCVGFDGEWKGEFNFDYCLDQAYKYIDNYKV